LDIDFKTNMCIADHVTVIAIKGTLEARTVKL